MLRELICESDSREDEITEFLMEDDNQNFKPGKDYVDAFGETCFGYGLDDPAEIMQYYKAYLAKKGGRLDVSPQRLARQMAIDHNIKEAFFKFDDDYFDAYMETAQRKGTSDDFILKFWDDMTSHQDTTVKSPEDMGYDAFNAYIHSPMYITKRPSSDEMAEIRSRPEPVSNKPLPKQIEISEDDVNSNPGRLFQKYADGYYYTFQYDKSGKARRIEYHFLGYTKSGGRGQYVDLIFNSIEARRAFMKAMWPGFMEPSQHLEAADMKTKPCTNGSECVIKNKEGETVYWTKQAPNGKYERIVESDGPNGQEISHKDFNKRPSVKEFISEIVRATANPLISRPSDAFMTFSDLDMNGKFPNMTLMSGELVDDKTVFKYTMKHESDMRLLAISLPYIIGETIGEILNRPIKTADIPAFMKNLPDDVKCVIEDADTGNVFEIKSFAVNKISQGGDDYDVEFRVYVQEAADQPQKKPAQQIDFNYDITTAGGFVKACEDLTNATGRDLGKMLAVCVDYRSNMLYSMLPMRADSRYMVFGIQEIGKIGDQNAGEYLDETYTFKQIVNWITSKNTPNAYIFLKSVKNGVFGVDDIEFEPGKPPMISVKPWSDIQESQDKYSVSDFLHPVNEAELAFDKDSDIDAGPDVDGGMDTGLDNDLDDDFDAASSSSAPEQAVLDEYTGDFPAWALDYVVNHELGSVSRLEKQQIEGWLAQMECNGYDTGMIEYGEDEYFSNNPEFGLPCDCVEMRVSKLAK